MTLTFVLCFVTLAAAMALWVDVRFPRLTPADGRGALYRLVGAIVVAQFGAPAVVSLVSPLSTDAEAATLVAVSFGAVTFLLLAALWMLKIAQSLVLR